MKIRCKTMKTLIEEKGDKLMILCIGRMDCGVPQTLQVKE